MKGPFGPFAFSAPAFTIAIANLLAVGKHLKLLSGKFCCWSCIAVINLRGKDSLTLNSRVQNPNYQNGLQHSGKSLDITIDSDDVRYTEAANGFESTKMI